MHTDCICDSGHKGIFLILQAAQLEPVAGAVPAPAFSSSAEDAATGPAWDTSAQVLCDGVEGCEDDDARAWLQEGYGWTRTSKRFWRASRKEEQPVAEAVQGVVEWLKPRGLAKQEWVKKFPIVVGLTADELEKSRQTAPSYLKEDEAFLRALRANPKLLGNNFDCLAEHEVVKAIAHGAGIRESAPVEPA
eukprot:CAMPEP_0172724004 /NCGR_PEP_ID=MMETSP1074-20121228/84958_1 /TAXON_ID=2916 /ORGANISM="Ceratium fusus, Strain PA161109" /LENGTH=190 /DNA_ID=CAMNT_0013550353 /DNA_START=138 /DNA_END=712 /DNA_ORIENTATION=-